MQINVYEVNSDELGIYSFPLVSSAGTVPVDKPND